jgi:uncharacterized protein
VSKLQTYTGRVVDPFDLRPEHVDVRDVAHALSMKCRYGGHCGSFYSVAQHAVLLSFAVEKVEPQHALWALHHDDVEAYLCDVPRPLKPYYYVSENFQSPMRLRRIEEVERQIQATINAALGVTPDEEPLIVRQYDKRICIDERAAIGMTSDGQWPAVRGLGISIDPLSPDLAERAFLARHGELTRRES